tara:strand:+ start:6036 stop:6821 length:786 start_codon:yes stop_codon:yes gene_type:complete
MKQQPALTFSNANAKLVAMAKRLGKTIKSFTLPSGWTCPGAKDCLSKANRQTGKIQDGPNTVFRCFAASSESQYKNTRAMVWRNFEALKDAMTDAWRYDKDKIVNVANLLESMLPKKFDIMRVHVGGDFFSQVYFDAWMEVARRNPNKHFYAYTKSLNFWVHRFDSIPSNFVLTASFGGKHDALIVEHGLKYAEVVYSEEEADAMGFEIDHDDYHAAFGKKNFALLIHGTQPKGSMASQALQELKRRGWNGYSKRKELATT